MIEAGVVKEIELPNILKRIYYTTVLDEVAPKADIAVETIIENKEGLRFLAEDLFRSASWFA